MSSLSQQYKYTEVGDSSMKIATESDFDNQSIKETIKGGLQNMETLIVKGWNSTKEKTQVLYVKVKDSSFGKKTSEGIERIKQSDFSQKVREGAKKTGNMLKKGFNKVKAKVVKQPSLENNLISMSDLSDV